MKKWTNLWELASISFGILLRSHHHSQWIRCLFIVLSFLLIIPCSNAQNFTISSRVVESNTNAPIPYASVYTQKNRKGTITKMDGSFELTGISQTDTIVFYFAGFEKTKMAASDVGNVVRLNPLEQLLDDVLVLADESIPYKLISNTRKNVRHKNEIAQSYIEMQSFQDDQQLEYFQGYYNGKYDGYDIDDLELKTARFGVKRSKNLTFLTHSTSHAMYRQDIFNSNEYFPDTPFGMKRRKLVKTFRVQMNAKYKEENGDVTYVLSFEPRRDSTGAFAGKVWIDSASNILTKVQLSIENADKCPFVPIHRGGELLNVNMQITKTYDRSAEGVRLNTMDFDYDFTFDSRGFYGIDDHLLYKERPADSINYAPIPLFQIHANAVLAAYNYNEQFFIPAFDFPDHFADYRKMMAFQDHKDFWNCYKTFRVGKSEEKEAFLDDPWTVTHDRIYKPSYLSEIGMYEFPYRQWSKKRIYLRPPKDTTQNIPLVQDGIPMNAQKYELVAQILFEIDILCDTLKHRTLTIFDPFQSYYKFERTPRSVAFHNVYFDLMEISRRELVAKLDAVENPTKEIWTKIYEEHMAENRMMIDTYFKEVDRGTREEEFLKWNAIVVNELGIDNNFLFAAPEEEEVSE